MKKLFYTKGLCEKKDEIEMIKTPLSPTNLYATYSVSVNGQNKYFYKKAINISEANFENELDVSIELAENKIAPEVLYFDKYEKEIVTEYIENDNTIDLQKKLKLIVNKLKQFHIKCNSFDNEIYNTKKEYWFAKYEILPIKIKCDFKCVYDLIKNQKYFYDKNDEVVSHNDFHISNILVNNRDSYIIDFDQIGYNSKYFDLATLAISLNLNNENERLILSEYCQDYDYEKFVMQKSFCIAQYALAVISLVEDIEKININKIENSVPFLWECNNISEINISRFKLAYNFLNYFKKLNTMELALD